MTKRTICCAIGTDSGILQWLTCLFGERRSIRKFRDTCGVFKTLFLRTLIGGKGFRFAGFVDNNSFRTERYFGKNRHQVRENRVLNSGKVDWLPGVMLTESHGHEKAGVVNGIDKTELIPEYQSTKEYLTEAVAV